MGYSRATATYTDNTTAQGLVANPVHHSIMKQLHLKYLYIRELNSNHVISCGRVTTQANPADLGTKALGANETVKKAHTFFDSIGDLDLDEVDRSETIANDYSN